MGREERENEKDPGQKSHRGIDRRGGGKEGVEGGEGGEGGEVGERDDNAAREVTAKTLVIISFKLNICQNRLNVSNPTTRSTTGTPPLSEKEKGSNVNTHTTRAAT